MVNCHCGSRASFLGEVPFCPAHFQLWLKETVETELGKFIGKKETLAIAVSGGKDSTALLDIVNDWVKNKDLKIFAICIDEGIKNYRDESLKFLRRFCSKKNIELKVVSFEKEIGSTLDKILESRTDLGVETKACTICGTFRRYLINAKVRELDATKVLFAHNRDDELQTLFMNLFTGNVSQISTKGEIGGITDHSAFVVRFKPLIDVPEKALATYALMKYPNLPDSECPYLEESARVGVRHFLNRLESDKPNSKKKIMKTYREKLLPPLKESAHLLNRTLNECEICKEPSSRLVCKVCELKKDLKLI
ncbi:MAG: TIGR00269 family protein [Candidatus Altiarchaeota archaeon]|nr:TIGR00269 family protein [Candidatus Altiarchaeota archaeon]